jgi:hypothetical protein
MDRWFNPSFVVGDGIQGGGNPVDFSLNLPGLSGQPSLTIRLWGYYDTDHELEITLNAATDPDPFNETYTWSGISFYDVVIDPAKLNPGQNTITMLCHSGTDGIIVDWFEVVYERDFTAEGDTLKFSHEEGYRFEVSNFADQNLFGFDITSPTEVKHLAGAQTTGGGPYSLAFEPQDGGGLKTYLTLSAAAIKTPSAISEDLPSNLADPTNGADYILITHRDLGWDGTGAPYPWLEDLATLRQAQGLRVMVVDVEDLYDEFSFGMVTPQAIKDFLSHAYTRWSEPAPQYVLLVGDSTYDAKDNLNLSTVNFVPAYLSFTQFMGETLTDEWFVQLSGDDAVADLYLGRLPAKSAAEAEVMARKIISYETSPNTKSWEKRVALVADNMIEPYEAVFETMNEDVAALMPQPLDPPFRGYLNDYLDPNDLTADIKDTINQGALVVNYSGHGSTQIWAHENVFDHTDVAALTNDTMLPLFVNMACLTGYFGYPEAYNFPSLAEALLRAEDKGAVAALMPTGMTPPEGQRVLDAALFDAIFTEDLRTLGPAIAYAKQTLLANGDYEEVAKSFLLFGDPAMRLKVPLPTRPEGLIARGVEAGVTLSWQEAEDCDRRPVAGYNLYRSTTAGGPYELVNDSPVTRTQYDDLTGKAVRAVAPVTDGTTYYYVVTSVDGDGDESVQSLEKSAAAGLSNSSTTTQFVSGGGGGGGCFISTVVEQ